MNLAKEPRFIRKRTRLNGETLNGEIIRVTAAAGTGKTTTMEAVAEKLLELGHPKVMYVTFTGNRKRRGGEVREGVGGEVPGRVIVKTTLRGRTSVSRTGKGSARAISSG